MEWMKKWSMNRIINDELVKVHHSLYMVMDDDHILPDVRVQACYSSLHRWDRLALLLHIVLLGQASPRLPPSLYLVPALPVTPEFMHAQITTYIYNSLSLPPQCTYSHLVEILEFVMWEVKMVEQHGQEVEEEWKCEPLSFTHKHLLTCSGSHSRGCALQKAKRFINKLCWLMVQLSQYKDKAAKVLTTNAECVRGMQAIVEKDSKNKVAMQTVNDPFLCTDTNYCVELLKVVREALQIPAMAIGAVPRVR
ncbi:hypothetical protein OE88DRAFT_1647689 [Heliocybe sulcata]|uniref:Uncharacterized protein n=1 Tax=Heliocybe sulcata TaxID=5364 RepID=A0A5C3MQJ8_9AGAM|nr:hypothetical protein OE88DRAFT_1647689 [Heliocybe sulcata]